MTTPDNQTELERFKALMEQARSEGETGDAPLDMLLMTSTPPFAALLRSLSIPHWFDERIVELLIPEGLGRTVSEVMEDLSMLSFVRMHKRGLTYHDRVREQLRQSTSITTQDFFRSTK